MKRRRNKKTGEIIEYDEEVIYYRKLTPNGHEDWTPYHPEDWEDCEPTEPYIEDEKVRKAIRAWAEANGASGEDEVVFEDGIEQGFRLSKYKGDITATITFGDTDLGLEDGKKYTITELCGKEKE